jgi:hypothetical protein
MDYQEFLPHDHEQGDRDPAAKAEEFAEWLRQEECVSDHVRIEFLGPDCGYGGVCIQSVQAGQDLLCLPASLLMDRAAAMRSQLGPCLEAHPVWADGAESSRPLPLPAAGQSRFSPPVAVHSAASDRSGGDSESAPPPDAWAIILLLLFERARGDASPWSRYIAMLPATIDAAATCFAPVEAAALVAGTPLAADAAAAEADLAR